MLEESVQPKSAESGKLPVEEFLVFYSLSGVLLARAASAEDASQKVSSDLHAAMGNANQVGIGSTEAAQMRLGDLEITISSVEKVIYQCQPAEDEYPATE